MAAAGAADIYPEGQAVHENSPATEENRPGMQSTHARAPVEAEKVPASQSVQV